MHVTTDAERHDEPVDSHIAPATRQTMRPTSRGKIVGCSRKLRDIIATVDRIAGASCNVLVAGESGTGKEVIVAALHDASPRFEGPLVTVNCGALPENLMESELFGHARGAFTGAHVTRQGRVAQAEGGTLFLDEIGELPLSLQAKLLRLLQQREYTPVGDNRTLHCDVRIVAATNRNLGEEVARGNFREDLYYRLNVITIEVPPLRERMEDLDVLVKYFTTSAMEMSGRDDLHGFEPAALKALREHDWPGNVRELENAVQRAVLLAPGPWITPRDLPAKLAAPRPRTELVRNLPELGLNLREVVDAYENNLIRQALERTEWNKNRAAQLLGINRTTLVEMVKRKGMSSPLAKTRCA